MPGTSKINTWAIGFWFLSGRKGCWSGEELRIAHEQKTCPYNTFFVFKWRDLVV